MSFVEEINSFNPYDDIRKRNQEIFLEYYRKDGDKIFDRESNLYHITASAVILNKDYTKMLCIYHNIYKNYGWTGGHNDSNPNSLEVAIKEAKEETGIVHFHPLNNKIYSLDILPVNTHIKHGKRVPTHLHLNLTYVFIASEDDKVRIKPDENSDVKWINVDELDKYTNEKEVLEIYLNVIEQVRKEKKEHVTI